MVGITCARWEEYSLFLLEAISVQVSSSYSVLFLNMTFKATALWFSLYRKILEVDLLKYLTLFVLNIKIHLGFEKETSYYADLYQVSICEVFWIGQKTYFDQLYLRSLVS